ncbi:MAG: hypothetical protein EBT81_07280 [Gammaproteobacteria bacterium]|nr:hypothetical protein [Gammaproteobacteria bacterium]
MFGVDAIAALQRLVQQMQHPADAQRRLMHGHQLIFDGDRRARPRRTVADRQFRDHGGADGRIWVGKVRRGARRAAGPVTGRVSWSIHGPMLESPSPGHDSTPHKNYSQPHQMAGESTESERIVATGGGRRLGLQVERSALLRVFRTAVASLLLAATGVAWASTEVSSIADEHVVTAGIEWCKAPRTETRAGISAGGCRFEPLLAGERGTGYFIGFQRESVWLRLRLRNDSDHEVARWLQTGFARASDVTVYQQTDRGEWSPSRLGYDARTTSSFASFPSRRSV